MVCSSRPSREAAPAIASARRLARRAYEFEGVAQNTLARSMDEACSANIAYLSSIFFVIDVKGTFDCYEQLT
jgi:hypothetical protein